MTLLEAAERLLLPRDQGPYYILDWLLPLVLVGWILLATFSNNRYTKDLIFRFNIRLSSPFNINTQQLCIACVLKSPQVAGEGLGLGGLHVAPLQCFKQYRSWAVLLRMIWFCSTLFALLGRFSIEGSKPCNET
jgi:hypothetical protein